MVLVCRIIPRLLHVVEVRRMEADDHEGPEVQQQQVAQEDGTGDG